jgi:chorismate dehydratase
VGIVNYLNTRPLVWGLQQLAMQGHIELTEDYPARIAAQLSTSSIDVGLIPVAVLPSLPVATIVGAHCIATNGEVGSVCLFSEQPLEQIDRVLLDYQSRTSVLLAQLLLKKYWKKEVEFVVATDESYIDKISGSTAGLIIGDRAFTARSRFPFCYDLGSAWKAFTGQSFVFAVWASVVPLTAAFIKLFDQANAVGLSQMASIAAQFQPQASYDLYHYFTSNIDYHLSTDKKEAVQQFLVAIQELPAIIHS